MATENKKQDEATIDLGEVLHVLWKNIILIVVITLCVTILGAVYTFAIVKEKYKSTAVFVVATNVGSTSNSSSSTTDNDYSISDTLRLIQTVAELVTDDVVLDAVAEEYSISSSSLANMIDVSYSTSSFRISVSVENVDNQLSKDLANGVVQQLIKVANTQSGYDFIKNTITQTTFAKAGEYSSPNKTTYMIVSVLIGFVLACVVVFIKEFFSTKFKSTKDIENLLEEKIIGYFPDDKTKGAKPLAKDTHPTTELLEPNARNYELYNKLLTNIKYSGLEKPYKVIMVTSSHEGELKSTILSNLAACIHYNKKKVVVVDLDTRRPVIHKVFKVSKELGLLEYLEGSATKEDIIKHSDVGVDIITAGKKIINPLVVIEHPSLATLIQELQKEYDYVLIDTPPVMISSDACSISKLCDGVLFNVTMNDVNKKEAAAAVKSLKMVDAKIIGVNVTKGISDKRSAGAYYYDYNYHYYSGYGHKSSGSNTAHGSTTDTTDNPNDHLPLQRS